MENIGTWRMLRIFPAKVDFFWFLYCFGPFSEFSALTQNLEFVPEFFGVYNLFHMKLQE
jgi:hypothetical protein